MAKYEAVEDREEHLEEGKEVEEEDRYLESREREDGERNIESKEDEVYLERAEDERNLEREEEEYPSTNSAIQGDLCKPSRFSRDPMRGFFLQTLLECAECRQLPARKFSTHNAWQLHLKTFHKHIKTMADYKKLHGDPDLVKFKHVCRLCQVELILNLNVVKRHLHVQHGRSLASYQEQFREELVQERRERPVVQPSHTLEGWWEGCLYRWGQALSNEGGLLELDFLAPLPTPTIHNDMTMHRREIARI